MMEESANSGGESIKVYIRVRPPDSYHNYDNSSTTANCLEVTTPTTVIVHSKPESKVFTFDNVAGPETTQETVFSTVGRPIIDGCMCGYNGTIFAYGQTGSGKTFTMIGPSDEETNSFSHELRGVIPRSFEYLFSLINREKQKYGDLVEYLCKCSFLEIYNEQIYDLLDQASTGLHLRESIKRGVYVDGISEEIVTSAVETYQVLTRGWINRRVASTSMNRESSRSHAVFMLSVESKTRESNNSLSKIRSSTLNLVDLAGSERQTDTQTAGLRLKEAGSINKSLSVLGNVIMALVEIAHGKSRHVHYRDSKLTFLLRDSLGGNARTTLVANVHPLAKCFGETLSTLQFARRAKMIKNKAVINEDTGGNVAQLQAEIKKLRNIINKMRGGDPSPGGSLSPLIEGAAETSYNEEAVQLKDMLAMSISMREKVETEKMALLERVDKLQELCRRKDKCLQSTKMILKLRDSRIAALEKHKQEDSPNEESCDNVKMLQEEINQLKSQLEHHPEVTKFAIENYELKAELKQLQEGTADVTMETKKELSRLHQYTLQLEKQVRGSLRKEDQHSEPSISASEVARLNSEIERLHHRCQQLQNDLNQAQQTLSLEREEHRVKLCSLENSLTLSRKTNQDYEHTIEAIKAKHCLERESLNESHIRAIKAIVTPQSVKRSKSVTSTPFSKLNVKLRQKLFFPPIYASRVVPDLEDVSFSFKEMEGKEEVEDPLLDIHDEEKVDEEKLELEEEGDGEGDFGEVVINELKVLQDCNCDLKEQIETQDIKLLQLSSCKKDLEMQLSELTDRHQKELEIVMEKEKTALYQKKMVEESKYQIEMAKDILAEEVRDLKICLQSADNELVELKSQQIKERNEEANKRDQLYQKIGELEQETVSKSREYEQTLTMLQKIQDEAETLKEEVIFKDYCLSEKDQELQNKETTIANLEADIQSLEEQLSLEMDKISALSREEEGSKMELASALSENAVLVKEIGQLRKELQEKLTAKQQELESTQTALANLTCRSSEDKEAISKLMGTVQLLRGIEGDLGSQLSTLKRDLQEKDAQLNHSMSKIETLTTEISSLQTQVQSLKDQHSKDIRAKDMENEVLIDEIEVINRRLNEQCEKEQKILADKEEEVMRLSKELAVKENEVHQLTQNQQERESLLQKVQSFIQDEDISEYMKSQVEKILKLETERLKYISLIDKLQERQEEKECTIQTLLCQVDEFEEIQRKYELLKTQHLSQQYKMEADKEDCLKREEFLRSELTDQTNTVKELQKQLSSLDQDKQQTILAMEEMQSRLVLLEQDYEVTVEQLERIRKQEDATFEEKENLRSQLEGVLEEKARLYKEHQDLVKENAALSGHRNTRQRIQFHAKLKMDHHKLLEDFRILEDKYQLQNQYIQELKDQMLLSEEVSPKSSERRVLRSTTRLRNQKENVNP